MDWNIKVAADWEPEFTLDRAPWRKIGRILGLILAVAAIAVVVYLVSRPDIAFEGRGEGLIDVGQVTLDGTYTMRAGASGDARVFLLGQAGICEWVAGDEVGKWLISAERCVARISIQAEGPVSYQVSIDRTN